MAPSGSHLHKLVVRNYKLLKAAWKTASGNLQSRLPVYRLESIPIRTSQPLHPIAALKQSRSRFNSSSPRHFSTGARSSTRPAAKPKSSWPTSVTRTAVSSLPGRTPFASTLRPNLTGGALPRTAGGYGLGSGRVGGKRYFSHTPAAPAQVVQSVSQAVRAFLLGGQKAQFDGVDARGSKRYRAVTSLQDSATRKLRNLPQATPGSFVDFTVNPTITALTPLSAVAGYAGFSSVPEAEELTETNTLAHLNASGLMDVLSADFSRALKDLAAILNDLKALSALGDLPITYRTEKSASVLRVHFPGCDADTVESLLRELDVKRGVVTQDAAFDAFAGTEVALLFPFAPSEGSVVSDAEERTWFQHKRQDDDWHEQMFAPEPDTYDDVDQEEFSTQSDSGLELLDPLDSDEGLLLELPLSLSSCEAGATELTPSTSSSPLEYQDFEGIYRFIELCDSARR